MLSILRLLTKTNRPENASAFEFRVNHKGLETAQINQFRTLFNLSEQHCLPISFAFIAGFSAIIRGFADRRFSVSPIGLVHLEASFSQAQAINYCKPFQLHLKFTPSMSIKGLQYQTTLTFTQNGCVCLINENIFLKPDKNKLKKSTKTSHHTLFNTTPKISINHQQARAYAKVSKDFNPIHIDDRLAKLFGQKKAIIHGMYLVHKCLIDKNINAKLAKFCFKRPCHLPTKIGLEHTNDDTLVFSGHDNLHLVAKFT
ncbi:MaoC/PaaZ C-terminal domain-containing protein [Thalassotalea aquiviva]|uniref:MaoC/PaaZ C-terminal domain-containing protein n=1 Tax=Thalassotalea aquiviva TaxID=3242415 RepID=UPI00352B76EA